MGWEVFRRLGLWRRFVAVFDELFLVLVLVLEGFVELLVVDWSGSGF